MLGWLRGFLSREEIKQPINSQNDQRTSHATKGPMAQSNESDLDDKPGEDRILIRPRGPYEQWWLPGLKCAPSADSCSQNGLQENRLSVSNETALPGGLNAFLLELEEHNSGGEQNATNRKIFQDVSYMINESFGKLDQKYPIFRDAVVHKVGSVGEQTKVGIYNEFDFMVELPALEERFEQEAIPMMQKYDPDSVVKIKNMEFMLDFIPQTQVTYVDNQIPDMFATLKSLVSQELFSCLLPYWQPGPNFKVGSSEDKGKVRTIRLRFSPEVQSSHIDVFCDLSFCVPFQWTPKKRFIFRRSGTHDDMESNNQRYRLLVRNSEFWVRTTALREKAKLCQSPTSQNAKKVYQLSKLLIGKFLPPKYDFKLDNFDGIIPSYWIKQIVLYLMDEFPDTESWQEDFLGHRFNQVIANLHKCLEKNMLCNYFSPMRNHLMDNSKTDETNMARKYVPLLAELLSRATAGDNSAIASFRTLEALTANFRSTVATKAKLMRLFLLLLRYKGLAWKDAYIIENTKFFSAVMEDEPLLAIIKDYIQFHFTGVIELHGEGRNLRIRHKDEDLSLDDFINKIRDDPHIFPDDWQKLYDRMLQERMPSVVLQSISHHTYRPVPIGKIVRTTFGATRRPLSLQNEYLMTNEFLIF